MRTIFGNERARIPDSIIVTTRFVRESFLTDNPVTFLRTLRMRHEINPTENVSTIPCVSTKKGLPEQIRLIATVKEQNNLIDMETWAMKGLSSEFWTSEFISQMPAATLGS